MRRGDVLGGAIIAAGEGSRLRADGFPMPKPLLPVAGVTLVEHALTNFAAAGITSLAIVVNESMAPYRGWLRAVRPELDVRVTVKTTASSLETFHEALAEADRPRTLVSTVDAWCRPGDFVAFADAALRLPAESLVLAVTPLVADERPLWVSLAADGRVERIGGESGRFVTAGLYVVPDRLRQAPAPPGLPRLRDFLAWVAGEGDPVFGVVVPDVVDVDRAEDVALAEAMAVARPSPRPLAARWPA